MSEIDERDYAFPRASTMDYQPGMTMRDWFAGMAITGLATLQAHPQCPKIDGQAKMAFEIADAMLAAREVKP